MNNHLILIRELSARKRKSRELVIKE